MAYKLNSMIIRAVDSDDDIRRIDTWGQLTVADYDKLQETIDAGSALHGLKVVGRIERFVDNTVDVSTIQIPNGQTLVWGELIIERDQANPVYAKGKFPNDPKVLDALATAFITGTRTIGGKQITGVVPKVNIGKKYVK